MSANRNIRYYRMFITKTYLYNFDPLKPHFYIVKLGFTGVYIIFFISAQKHRLWVLVRTASASFLSENFQFLEVKFSIYLNRRVFVMFNGNKCPDFAQEQNEVNPRFFFFFFFFLHARRHLFRLT